MLAPGYRAEEFAAGIELPPQVTGPWTSAHIVRWCAAQQNWDRIHHDADYARAIAGLPHPVINGALKQNLIVRFLQDSFPAGAWLWQVDCSFVRHDFVGDELQAQGQIVDVQQQQGSLIITVEVTMRNCSSCSITSSASAVMVMALDGSPTLDAFGLRNVHFPYPDEQEPDLAGVPKAIAARIGRQLEHLRSYTPVDRGRLRLFADALGCRSPMYYDVEAGRTSIHGSVVALPWFPAHALSMRPGERDLAGEPKAMGREAVCEVGRDMPSIFNLPPQGLRSAGNRARFHSLLRLDETVEATSCLAGVKCAVAEDGNRSLIFRTRNEYRTTTGRPLLSEMTTILCRLE